MSYDIVLKEKVGIKGLTKAEVTCMFELLPEFAEVYPVKYSIFGIHTYVSSAMGFITAEAASKLDYYIEKDTLIANYIGYLMSDKKMESETGEYEFMGLKIYLMK